MCLTLEKLDSMINALGDRPDTLVLIPADKFLEMHPEAIVERDLYRASVAAMLSHGIVLTDHLSVEK